MSLHNTSFELTKPFHLGIDEVTIQFWDIDVEQDADIIVIKSKLTTDIILGYLWWILLTSVSLCNCYMISKYWRQWMRAKLSAFQVKMLYLSSIYVIVCAIRAIWPRKDHARVCFIDHFISSVIVGRTIATVAEMCFAQQLSLVLAETIRKYTFDMKSSAFMQGYRYYVSWIFVAEVFSWFGVITTCQIWHAFEESIWMLTGLHMTVSYFILYRSQTTPRASKVDRRHFEGFIVSGIAFVVFMCLVDVPMYFGRYVQDTYVNGVEYFGVSDGIADLMSCKQVVHDFSIWWDDIPWMTGYFSVAVWLSIYLINIPLINDHRMHGSDKKSK